MKKLLSSAMVIAIIFIYINTVFAEPSKTSVQPPKIDDGAFILIDSKSGEVLFQKDADRKGLYPASTTKIMTAILALERGNLDQVMEASETAVDEIGKDGSNIGIMAGEKIRMEDLLKALLICSANETANIIAENLCQNKEAFVALMNDKAKALGAVNTHYMNPCGSQDDENYNVTTPSDLARIARYAMTFPKFREIVGMTEFQMPPTNKHATWPVLGTTNKLMSQGKYKSDMYVVNGIKTGYTGPAGYNLVASAQNDSGMELISVIMDVKNEGGQENVRKYTKDLLDYGFENFSVVTLQTSGTTYESIPVEDAADNTPLGLVTKEGLQYVLPNVNPESGITIIPHIKSNITAPVNQGDLMGYIDYLKDGVSIGRVDLTASRSVKQKTQTIIIHKVKSVFDSTLVKAAIAVASLMLIFIILRLILRIVSRRVNSRRLE